MSTERELEEREVVSDDPSLSPEANRLLTEELREAVGADRVQVPRDAPRHERDRHGDHSSVATLLAANRVLVAITFASLIVVGVIIALATGSWWAVVIAAAVHAIGTFFVLTTLGTAAEQTEHVDPTVAARLAEEGVPDPDAQLSDLVEEFSGERTGESAAELTAPGENEQTADPRSEPAKASAQQRTVNTPSAEPSAPAGVGAGREGQSNERSATPARSRQKTLLILAGTVLAVAVFVLVMGLVGGFL